MSSLARARSIALCMLAALAAACTSEPAPSPSPPGGSGASGAAGGSGATGSSGVASTMTLRVMEFNVEYGGTVTDFSGVPAAIEAAGADVVAIEEGYANMPAIADSVGWPYYDNRSQVMSRFPILRPAGDRPYVLVEVAPGSVIAVANVHLPSTSYGPFKARDGASAAELEATEEHKRLPVIEPVLQDLEELVGQGIPVFLAGDFNAPSHLDWTEESVGTREQIRFPVDWPVSQAVDDAGLVDSFRAANPDPVADPGITWPANRPVEQGYDPYANGAPADRIDFIYAGGPATVTESLLVGEEGGPGVDVPVSPWPTDHRAVVSTFDVEPGPEPTLLSADQRLVTKGDEVTVRYHADGAAAGSVAVVPAGGDPATAVDEMAIGDDEATGGEVSFSTFRWRPGEFEAVLLSTAGEELARAPVWVQVEGGEPQLRTSAGTYAVGDPIDLEWRFTPGNRADWIGVYRQAKDPSRASYLLFVYTGGTVAGSATFDRDTVGPWPLEPGEYSFYLLRDDSYVDLARTDFTVR